MIGSWEEVGRKLGGSSWNSRKSFWKGNGLCKGPEVGMQFAPSRNKQELRLVGAE